MVQCIDIKQSNSNYSFLLVEKYWTENMSQDLPMLIRISQKNIRLRLHEKSNDQTNQGGPTQKQTIDSLSERSNWKSFKSYEVCKSKRVFEKNKRYCPIFPTEFSSNSIGFKI